MSGWLWITLAAVAATLVAVWAYAYREEPVRGRAGPALLRGLAIFLLLAGVRLPRLPQEAGSEGVLVLLDRSESMGLPARHGGPSRYDSALSLLAGLSTRSVMTFGDRVAFVSRDSLPATPDAPSTSLAPALEAARLAGFDSVLILGDGEWDDPASSADLALSLGLGVRELRLGGRMPRVGLRDASVPRRVAAGDTVRLSFQIVAGGEDGSAEGGKEGARPDSLRVFFRGPDVAQEVALPRPAGGRALRGEIRWVPARATSGSEWRRYELTLEEGADPYGAADRAQLLLEVGAEPGGTLLLSEQPDWEPSFLLPLLERLSPAGARAYLRVGPDLYVQAGSNTASVGPERVRRAVETASLLVVQGAPNDLPTWLLSSLGRHPRKLFLLSASGSLAGFPVESGGLLEGEWYADQPARSGPTGALLSGLELAQLPPIRDVVSLAGSWEWAPLIARRDRRGEARPLAVVGRDAGSRWAITTGSGYWRWAFRGLDARRAYEALFGGVVGWLLEGIGRRPVDLAETPLASMPLRFSAESGITNLTITVYDSIGEILWTEFWEEAPDQIVGPGPARGSASFQASGEGRGGRFEIGRPILVRSRSSELQPRVKAPEIALPASVAERDAPPPGRSRGVWPFAAAILLLGGEWIWRRRLGLR